MRSATWSRKALRIASSLRRGFVLALLFVFPILALVVADPDWQRHLQRISPMTAGLAVKATVDVSELPIGPWQGLDVLVLWAAGALTAGGWLRWSNPPKAAGGR